MSNTIQAEEPLVFPEKDFDISGLVTRVKTLDKKGKYDFNAHDNQWYLVYWFIGPEQIEVIDGLLQINIDQPRNSDLSWRSVTQIVRSLLAPYYTGTQPQQVRILARDLDWDDGATPFYQDVPLEVYP